MRGTFTFLLLATASLGHVAFAAPGDLDTTFGSGGKVLVGVGAGQNDLTRAMTIDASGNLYVTGVVASTTSNDFAAIRLLPNGQLDSNFGVGGRAIVDIGANSNDESETIALDGSGNVYLAGTTDVNTRFQFAAMRLMHAGTRDASFGTNGVALVDNPTTNNDACCGIALDSSGALFLVGSTISNGKQQMKLAKLTSAGCIANFGTAGYTYIGFNGNTTTGVAVIPDGSGNIFVASSIQITGGINMALVQFDSAGDLDSGFHSMGASYANVTGFDLSANMARDKNGNFFIVGRTGLTTTAIGIAKFDKTGTLVDAFGTHGTKSLSLPGKSTTFANDVKIDGDGNLYLAITTNGTSTTLTPGIAAVDGATGALMSTFGNGGFVTADVPNVSYGGKSVALDPTHQRVCLASERGDLTTPANFAVACFVASTVNAIFSSNFE